MTNERDAIWTVTANSEIARLTAENAGLKRVVDLLTAEKHGAQADAEREKNRADTLQQKLAAVEQANRVARDLLEQLHARCRELETGAKRAQAFEETVASLFALLATRTSGSSGYIYLQGVVLERDFREICAVLASVELPVVQP